MIANKKPTGNAAPLSVGVILGGGVSSAVTIVLSALLAFCIINEKLGTGVIGYAAMFIVFISSLSGSLVAALKIKRRRMFVCQITGLLYFLLLLACTALCFGGQFHGSWVSGLLVFFGSTVSSFISAGKNSERVSHKRNIKKLLS